jgi:hypothetical protein
MTTRKEVISMTSKFSKAFLASVLMIMAFGAFMPMQSQAFDFEQPTSDLGDETNPIKVVGRN